MATKTHPGRHRQCQDEANRQNRDLWRLLEQIWVSELCCTYKEKDDQRYPSYAHCQAHLNEMPDEVSCTSYDPGYLHLLGRTNLLCISSHCHFLLVIAFKITLGCSVSIG